jgi:serine/threonine-protein kinase
MTQTLEINGYEIIGKVGEGRMGLVFKAKQSTLDRIVAIKMLNEELASRSDVIENFDKEAKACAKLNHPHIVTGIDAGSSNNVHYFVMEFMDGKTLAEKLDESGRIEEKECAEYLLQMAKALVHAEEKGMLHCDIKPDNMMLNSIGHLKLTDLGLAQTAMESDSEEQRIVRGTPHYISPEQIHRKSPLSHRTDIYSLGASFFHLLTGSPPFSGNNAKEIALSRLKEDVPHANEILKDISPELNKLLIDMMQKDPKLRPTATKVLTRVEKFLKSGTRIVKKKKAVKVVTKEKIGVKETVRMPDKFTSKSKKARVKSTVRTAKKQTRRTKASVKVSSVSNRSSIVKKIGVVLALLLLLVLSVWLAMQM